MSRIVGAPSWTRARKGRVFADRYHAHILPTPTQGRPIPRAGQDPCATAIDAPFTAPGTWLLQKGWRRARLV